MLLSRQEQWGQQGTPPTAHKDKLSGFLPFLFLFLFWLFLPHSGIQAAECIENQGRGRQEEWAAVPVSVLGRSPTSSSPAAAPLTSLAPPALPNCERRSSRES